MYIYLYLKKYIGNLRFVLPLLITLKTSASLIPLTLGNGTSHFP